MAAAFQVPQALGRDVVGRQLADAVLAHPDGHGLPALVDVERLAAEADEVVVGVTLEGHARAVVGVAAREHQVQVAVRRRFDAAAAERALRADQLERHAAVLVLLELGELRDAAPRIGVGLVDLELPELHLVGRVGVAEGRGDVRGPVASRPAGQPVDQDRAVGTRDGDPRGLRLRGARPVRRRVASSAVGPRFWAGLLLQAGRPSSKNQERSPPRGCPDGASERRRGRHASISTASRWPVRSGKNATAVATRYAWWRFLAPISGEFCPGMGSATPAAVSGRFSRRPVAFGSPEPLVLACFHVWGRLPAAWLFPGARRRAAGVDVASGISPGKSAS